MDLLLFRHLWGVTESWEDVFPRIKEEGFAGIETVLPEADRRDLFLELLDAHGFEYVAAILTAGATVEDHLASFREQMAAAAALKPRFVNCHSGRDSWTFDESARFYAEALAIEAQMGLPVAHETHRGRVFYNPWTTAALLRQFDTLKLCCDLSHWVCVCERLLDEATDDMGLYADRCLHIHARVGYEEGPQVPDPRAPEFKRHLESHEAWWTRIWQSQRARGMRSSTLTPEYGPPMYMHTLPYTSAPVADVWEICLWQAQREAGRFEQVMSGSPA
jgi:sugar phosphate isomerase/epimerase